MGLQSRAFVLRLVEIEAMHSCWNSANPLHLCENENPEDHDARCKPTQRLANCEKLYLAFKFLRIPVHVSVVFGHAADSIKQEASCADLTFSLDQPVLTCDAVQQSMLPSHLSVNSLIR